MVKIFGHRIFESFKGFFATSSSPTPKRRDFWLTERSWESRCKYYDRVFMQHPLAKSQILTLAGQFVADGTFLKKATDEEPHGQRAQDALYECEQLNKQVNLSALLYDTVIGMAKYGSLFWEKTTEPRFDFRIIPMQETIDPKTQDEQGNIIAWRQRSISGAETASWTNEEIVHNYWNITTYSWPYGTSLLVGLDTELEILETLEQSIKDFMEKTAFPKELYQIGDASWTPSSTDSENIKSTIKNWKPGDAFVTNAPVDYKAGGVGPKAIANLDDVMQFYKMQCIDGLLTPPVSIQYSSTMASSKEMGKKERANLILPLQRILAWNLREYIYKPYLEGLGFSVKLCPELSYSPPDADFLEKAQAYTQLVQAEILTPEMAASEMGYSQQQIEEMRLEREKKRKQEMEMAQQRLQGQGFMQKPNVESPKEGTSKFDEPKARY